jgi:transcriptional regulator with XRE-family HTH domain
VKRRGRRGPGIRIVPDRVRQARLERGLSLAELAGAEVSRAFIHQLEQGLARPSLPVLEMIARRTGKPVEFFIGAEGPPEGAVHDLAVELTALSRRLERLLAGLELSEAGREGMRIVIGALRHGSRLLTAASREARPSDRAGGEGRP